VVNFFRPTEKITLVLDLYYIVLVHRRLIPLGPHNYISPFLCYLIVYIDFEYPLAWFRYREHYFAEMEPH
jgi:hypothetical protein